ncbi:MLP-like protein 43 [Durio zibethinus]|uniref:MLP-like protein 43 n=1 Tax=Durio zibethinus TaxID=66656 RepID=A0A6P6BH55_DURZI|nr:MLP-like protein 43 [Durio zibethinus]
MHCTENYLFLKARSCYNQEISWSKIMASSVLAGKLETDVEIKASPQQFHDMLSNKPHHVHHTCNDKIQGCDLHEGDWGTVGSIVCWSYVHDGKAKTAKELVEAIDAEKNSITFRVVEGDLMKEYKSFLITIQASPKSGVRGSVVHWTMEYEKLHEGISHPETLLQFAVDVSKDIDSYLTQAN